LKALEERNEYLGILLNHFLKNQGISRTRYLKKSTSYYLKSHLNF